jgi:hypothetical protein
LIWAATIKKLTPTGESVSGGGGGGGGGGCGEALSDEQSSTMAPPPQQPGTFASQLRSESLRFRRDDVNELILEALKDESRSRSRSDHLRQDLSQICVKI